MSDLSFYVHIPYCVKRCGYCDFNTYTPSELREGGTLETVSGDYIDAVLREIDIAYAQAPDANVPTIFFGGGTPSLLPARDLGRVISSIKEKWNLASDAEVTLEANPDSKVVEAARGAGFESISLDLIYGTPGETLENFRTSVISALDLGIDHLSAYALIVESGTKLAAQIKRGDLTMPNDDLMADMYLLVDDLCEKAGMSWYELSNWSRPNHESRHNVAYWRNANWWGLGPGAHSHVDGIRWWNVKHPTAYKSALFAGTSSIQEREVLTSQQKADEAIMLSIRMRGGISLSDLSIKQREKVGEYRQSGHLDSMRWDEGTLQLTANGRLIADRIVRELVV